MKVSSNHVPALDGVRGLALLAVMVHHLSDFLPSGGVISNAVKTALHTGWWGVDLFFVLSGFLITGILLDTKESANYFSSFYARRALRIFPLYYSVLTAIVLLAAVTRGPHHVLPLPHDRIFYFFYLNNWWILLRDSWRGNIIGHFWSLAVEEQFYAIWPLCVWLLPKVRLIPVALGGIVLALVIRIWLYAEFGPIRDIVENTFARMDALLVGALLAALVRDSIMLMRYRRVVYASAVVCGLFAVFGGFPETVLFSLIAVLFGAVVLHAFEGGNALIRAQPLRTVGKYSYGMYVYHVPLLWFCGTLLTQPMGLGRNGSGSWLFLVGMIAATFAIAFASFNLFEVRFLNLKRKFDTR